jgi:hypothetical protein
MLRDYSEESVALFRRSVSDSDAVAFEQDNGSSELNFGSDDFVDTNDLDELHHEEFITIEENGISVTFASSDIDHYSTTASVIYINPGARIRATRRNGGIIGGAVGYGAEVRLDGVWRYGFVTSSCAVAPTTEEVGWNVNITNSTGGNVVGQVRRTDPNRGGGRDGNTNTNSAFVTLPSNVRISRRVYIGDAFAGNLLVPAPHRLVEGSILRSSSWFSGNHSGRIIALHYTCNQTQTVGSITSLRAHDINHDRGSIVYSNYRNEAQGWQSFDFGIVGIIVAQKGTHRENTLITHAYCPILQCAHSCSGHISHRNSLGRANFRLS